MRKKLQVYAMEMHTKELLVYDDAWELSEKLLGMKSRTTFQDAVNRDGFIYIGRPITIFEDDEFKYVDFPKIYQVGYLNELEYDRKIEEEERNKIRKSIFSVINAKKGQ